MLVEEADGFCDLDATGASSVHGALPGLTQGTKAT
jgi:hypothetical protein